LGRIGQASAISALRSALADSHWQVRQRALQSLGVLKAVEAVSDIASLLEHDLPTLRKEAAAALGEIADPAARIALERRADDADPEVRKTVYWALGRLGGQQNGPLSR
jgi:HEAT repeat protein